MVMPSPAEGRPALATALPPQRGRCPGREAPSPPRARAALTPQAARRLRGTRKEAPTDSLHDSVLSDNYLDSSRSRASMVPSAITDGEGEGARRLPDRDRASMVPSAITDGEAR